MFTARAKTLAGLLLLLLAGLAVYHTALDRGWVYDDILTVRDNALITDPGNLLRLLGVDYLRAAGEQTYRPVTTATYIVDHAIWGKAPFGFALTNFLIHLLAAWLLAQVLRRAWPERPDVAWAAALLFLVHPALVETAIVPSNREQVLSVLLILLTTRAWLWGRDTGARAAPWLAGASFVVGCYTLEWTVLLPAVLAGWAWCEGDSLRDAVASVFWLGVLAVVYLLLWAFVHPKIASSAPWLGGGPAGGLWAFGTLFWRYVRIALLPLGLRPSYTYVAPPVWLGLLAQLGLWLVVAGAAWALVRRRRWGLGVGLFVAGLLPVSHIFMAFWIPLAERYLALPLLGLLPVLAWGLLGKGARWRWALVAAVALAWGVLAHQHANDWRQGRDLWAKAVVAEPGDAVGWTNLGAAMSTWGRRDEAVDAHRRAWELVRGAEREFPDHVLRVAEALAQAGKRDQACDLLREQRERFSPRADWLQATGGYCAGHDNQAARDALAVLISRAPDDCAAWARLCVLDPSQTPACLREALIHCPADGQLWLHVASLHAAAGDRAKTTRAVAMALASPDADRLRGAALAILQRLP